MNGCEPWNKAQHYQPPRSFFRRRQIILINHPRRTKKRLYETGRDGYRGYHNDGPLGACYELNVAFAYMIDMALQKCNGDAKIQNKLSLS